VQLEATGEFLVAFHCLLNHLGMYGATAAVKPIKTTEQPSKLRFRYPASQEGKTLKARRTSQKTPHNNGALQVSSRIIFAAQTVLSRICMI
jgi:hypothetical protein